MNKQQIDQETLEIQKTFRLAMSTIIAAALLMRSDRSNEVCLDEAMTLTEMLIEKHGGLPL